MNTVQLEALLSLCCTFYPMQIDRFKCFCYCFILAEIQQQWDEFIVSTFLYLDVKEVEPLGL